MAIIEKTPKELFEENMKLVYYIARRYKTKSNALYFEDYVQEGMLGLWRASNTYDSSKGYTFATYASTCITNNILMYFRKFNRPIYRHLVSYDTVFRDKDGELKEFERFLEDPNSGKEYEAVDDRLSVTDKTLSVLTKREREVLHRIFYLDEKQADVARSLGCSQSYVSRLQQSALKKLKKAVGV